MEKMKSIWLLALMMMGSMVGMAEEAVPSGVTVDIDTFMGGTVVEKEQSEPANDGSVVVTITVTPAMGYSIAKDDIEVYATIPAAQTREGEGTPGIADLLTLSYDGSEETDVEDKTLERDYTFTVPAGLGAWVRAATFHSALNISKDENSEVVWAYNAETKALTISGTGETFDFEGEGFVDPWASFRAEITTVTVEAGVTGLGAKIFDGCTSLTAITILGAEQVVAFGAGAIPEGVAVDVPGNLYNEYLSPGLTVTSTAAVEMTGVNFGDNNHYDTFVGAVDMMVPSVLKAYIITGISGSDLVLSEVSTIPAGVPVLVYSEALTGDDFRSAGATEAGQVPTSLLKVAPEGGKEVALGEVYLLYNDVFYYAQAGTIAEGGVYLEPETQNMTRGYYALTRGGETAIDSQRIVSLDSKAPWYTLDGRKLSTMPSKKGIYIKDGKKVIIK